MTTTSTGARVLVVDDSRLNRRLLAQAVSSLGYDALSAADGHEALALLRAGDAPDVDVVLLDLIMPGLDGFAVLAALKGDPSLQHLPTIVVSAADDLDSVIRCIELGAADHLAKPVHRSLLRARLAASLAAKRLRDVERDHLEQVDRVIAAAVAVEAGRYEDEDDELDVVGARPDALGALARVLRSMARQVAARESALRAEVAELRIEIDRSRLDRRVAEVTGSSYYRRLTDEAAELKRWLSDERGDDG